MKYIVYLTTNIKNNKIYVGVHGTENPEIFDGYLGNGVNINYPSSIKNPKCPFQYAVKKYGFSSFKRTTIRVFDTQQEALDLEEYIVDEEFIKRQDTYNITIGGGLPPLLNKIIYQYSLDGNFIKEWDSIVKAANYYNISQTSIGKAVLYKRTSCNYLWSDMKFTQLDISEYSVYSPKIPVYIYDDLGEFVKTYNSLSECVKDLHSNLSHVQRAIKTGCRAGGFFISTKLTSVYEKPKKERLVGKVHQYNLDGTYIKSFNSIKEVEQEFKQSMQGINPSIKMGEQYKGFLWLRGEKQNCIKPYKKPKCSARKIGQYTMDDKLVKVFNTVREARKEFPNVSKVLNGSAKHCHNYKFKYLE